MSFIPISLIKQESFRILFCHAKLFTIFQRQFIFSFLILQTLRGSNAYKGLEEFADWGPPSWLPPPPLAV